jgi:PTS system ascorbate-specific IIA component
MTALVIVAHAPLASALRDVGAHVVADCANCLAAVDVPPDWAAEQVELAVREAMLALGQPQVLILADVFGATPCNGAQRVADGAQVRLVTGVNVPMLWRVLTTSERPLEALVERALAGGTQGVMPASAPKPQDQSPNPSPHDSPNRHHQQ